MKYLKCLSFCLFFILLLSFSACSEVDKNYGIKSNEVITGDGATATDEELPEVTSLDNKMSKYFDISVFDEENYANIYLGKYFDIKAEYANTDFTVPTTIAKIAENGWKLVSGSDYDENSLIFAKETVSLYFTNDNGGKIWALFYNSSNSSVRLSKCNIVKFRIENNYFKDKENYSAFNVNGITNTTVVTDVVDILGTPSHFYSVTEDTYYFDYFLQKRDRRNKIRIYLNLTEDAVTAIEFSYYK